MKLVIQIPCHNEEESLPHMLADLPSTVPGFDAVEWILVDDGSTDLSVELARAAGVHHVVSLPRRQGLATAFLVGLETSLQRGADVIVHTDADNQYRGADVLALVQPILEGRADVVVGERPISQMPFSPTKKLLQRLGSTLVRWASGSDVPDSTSGFRAYTREAAIQVNVFSTFSYTLETLIQLGLRRARIFSVPVRVNRVTRPSRLFRSVPEFVRRQGLTIVRIYALYRPFEIFAVPGTVCGAVGGAIGLRFLVFHALGHGYGHIQSLILASILISTGGLLLLAAMLASLIAANRVMLEDVRVRLRRMELANSGGHSHPRPAAGPVASGEAAR
jgi:glycosyltransferase involved in cell wall biosynthesis